MADRGCQVTGPWLVSLGEDHVARLELVLGPGGEESLFWLEIFQSNGEKLQIAGDGLVALHGLIDRTMPGGDLHALVDIGPDMMHTQNVETIESD